MVGDKQFKKERRREQLLQDVQRTFKRFGWRARKVLDVLNLVLLAWFGMGVGILVLNLLTWFHLEEWIGVEIDEVFAGVAFFVPILLLGGIRVVFGRWEREGSNTYYDRGVSQQAARAEAGWAAEDEADERRWQDRIVASGAVSVVDDNTERGNLSPAGEAGELALKDSAGGATETDVSD